MKFVIIYFLLINFVAFSMFAIDKRKAIKNQWRISEAALFTISILGGVVGSLSGMYICRHKTKHLKFTIGLPSILLVQVVILTLILK